MRADIICRHRWVCTGRGRRDEEYLKTPVVCERSNALSGHSVRKAANVNAFDSDNQRNSHHLIKNKEENL